VSDSPGAWRPPRCRRAWSADPDMQCVDFQRARVRLDREAPDSCRPPRCPRPRPVWSLGLRGRASSRSQVARGARAHHGGRGAGADRPEPRRDRRHAGPGEWEHYRRRRRGRPVGPRLPPFADTTIPRDVPSAASRRGLDPVRRVRQERRRERMLHGVQGDRLDAPRGGSHLPDGGRSGCEVHRRPQDAVGRRGEGGAVRVLNAACPQARAQGHPRATSHGCGDCCHPAHAA
jgi:hypothetical protein